VPPLKVHPAAFSKIPECHRQTKKKKFNCVFYAGFQQELESLKLMKARLLQELSGTEKSVKTSQHESNELEDEWFLLQDQIAAETRLIRDLKAKVTATKEISSLLGSKIETEMKKAEGEHGESNKEEEDLKLQLSTMEAEV
jgi:chromosome segregation ATPase